MSMKTTTWLISYGCGVEGPWRNSFNLGYQIRTWKTPTKFISKEMINELITDLEEQGNEKVIIISVVPLEPIK